MTTHSENNSKERIAYFPGCAALSSCPEADVSTRLVAKALNMELVPLTKATCCGAGIVEEKNPALQAALNARIFALAEKENLETVLTICSTCTGNMIRALHTLKEEPQIGERTNKVLSKYGLSWQNKTDVKHLLWLLAREPYLQKLKKQVKTSLKGIRIAAFYGCHILRPTSALTFESSENPSSMETIFSALGATPIIYQGRVKCCGFHTLMIDRSGAVKMAGASLLEAKDAGAELMVTPCPLCHLVLDGYQGPASSELHKRIKLPVLHLSQIIGLAFGFSPKELGITKHLTSAKPVLHRIESVNPVRKEFSNGVN